MDWHISMPWRMKIAVDRRTIPGAPAGLHGLKAVFISDIHLLRGMDPAPVADLINGCEPDLILMGGDYSDHRDQALRLFDAFRALKAPLGIFACAGNNDMEAFDSVEALADAMSVFGAHLLHGNSVSLDIRGTNLLIGGIGEYKYGRPDYAGIFPETAGNAYRILLSHYPILPKAAPQALPELMLCGHTHGGQFNAFGLNPYSIGFERIGKEYPPPIMTSGLLRFGSTAVLTSKGIGVSRIPLRIGVRPEVHILTFSD